MEEITRIRHKRLAGEALSAEDKEILRRYYAQYDPTRISVTTKVAIKQTWDHLAKGRGITLSRWVVEQVERSLMPMAPEVEAAKAEAQAARDQVTALRKTIAELAAENGALNDQLRALEGRLADAFARMPAILEALKERQGKGVRA